MSQTKRRYPIGAELIGENQAHFRIWAPKARKVDIVLEDALDGKPKVCPLTAEPAGYFSGAANASAGNVTDFVSTMRTISIPIRLRVFNPMGHTVPRALSIR